MLTLQEHSCAWRMFPPGPKTRPVDQNAEIAAEIRSWMLRVMEQTGLSVSAWAEKAGVARTTIARPIKDGYQFITSGRTLVKLAQAAGVSPPDFAGGEVIVMPTAERGVGEVRLPIRYEVAAGEYHPRADPLPKDAWRAETWIRCHGSGACFDGHHRPAFAGRSAHQIHAARTFIGLIDECRTA